MGVFFTVPLYLQLVLGLDALETGIKMLPGLHHDVPRPRRPGSRLSTRFPVRTIVRAGLVDHGRRVTRSCSPRSTRPRRTSAFAMSMALLGVGMGLMVSQLGNVVQSSVDASGRGEAGGLQYTGQQLGSSLGVALIGAIVLAGPDQRLRLERSRTTSASATRSPPRSAWPSRAGIDFVAADRSRPPPRRPGSTRPPPTPSSRTTSEAQLRSLKAGLLAAAFLALLALPSPGSCPTTHYRAARTRMRAVGPTPQ